MSIPLPELSVHTPSTNETIAAFSRLIGLRNQTEAQDQALQEDRQRFQQSEADQQKFQAAVRDGGGDPVATGKLLLKYGVQPKTLQTYTNYVNELNQGAQRMQANQLAISAKLNDMASGGMQGMMKVPQAQRQAAYDSWKANPVTQQWAKASGVELPALAPDNNWFQMHISQNTLGSDIATANIKKQQLAIQQQEANRPTAASLAVGASQTDANGQPTLQAIKDRHALAILQGPQIAKAPQTKTLLGPDGKAHVYGFNGQTGKFDRDLGVSPPNYAMAMLPTRTITKLGPDGLQHRYQFNDRTQAYDIDMGAAPTGAIAHSVGQASVIKLAGEGLINDIRANSKKFGNVGAILNSAFLGTPLADPASQELAAEISSFAALQPSLHGFRGQQALGEFKKLLGGLPNNPEALIGGIQGILKTAGAFSSVAAGKGETNTPALKPGTIEDGYRFKGGDPADKNNWEKVK